MDEMLRIRGLVRGLSLVALLVLLHGCGSSPVQPSLNEGQYDALSRAVLEESNLARTDPAAYVALLQQRRQRMKGRLYYRENDPVAIMTYEGVKPVDEALAVMGRQSPLAALQWSEPLAELARQHVADTGRRGMVGHDGSNGNSFAKRIARLPSGAGVRVGGENISYGHDEGREVVMQLLVDDGVPSRGHRENLLNPEFNAGGIGCGYHRKYGSMCVAIYGVITPR